MTPDAPPTVTINDVAQAAGVSKMTVSNVINGKAGVRPGTRARVEAAIEATGYRVNPLARALAGGPRGLIGVIAPSLTWPYVGEVIHGASHAAEALGVSLALFTAPLGRSLDTSRRSLLRHLADGVLLVLPDAAPGWADPADLPERVLSLDGPGAHQLLVDHAQGARLAMEHLLSLGHRRIAHIAGPVEQARDHAARRLRGYRDALRRAGLAPRPEDVRRGDYSEESGRRAALDLLCGADPPSAIFAANDGMAIGTIHAAQDLGLTLPRDLSVVGFDDLPGATAVRPGLTTVRQPLRQLGADAVTALVGTGGSPLPLRRRYPTELIVRGSSAPPGG